MTNNNQIDAVFKYHGENNSKRFRKIKYRGIIERIGPNKGGYWKILQDKHPI